MRRILVALALSFLLACGGDEKPANTDPNPEPERKDTGMSRLNVEPGEGEDAPEKPAEPVAPADPDVALFRRAEILVASGDPEDRMQAIVVLREAKDQGRAGRYVARLLFDEDEDVRGVAAEAIGKFAYPAAGENLRNLVEKEESELVRKQAIQSLFEIEGNRAVPTLIGVLKNDDEASVQAAAANLLGRSGAPEAVDPLVAVLKDAFNDQLQLETIAALRKLKAKKATDAVIDALQYANVLVRAEAARTLGELGEKKAVPALVEAVSAENEDGQVLIAITDSLVKLTGEKREAMAIDDSAGEEEQNAVIEAWKEWWKEHQSEY